jgi:hypothetical protein
VNEGKIKMIANLIFYSTKGLFIRTVEAEGYLIEDVFGKQTDIFKCRDYELDARTIKIANTRKLVRASGENGDIDLYEFRWAEIEEYYILKVEHQFKRIFLSAEEIQQFSNKTCYLPVAYLDAGYGDGTMKIFEKIHKETIDECRLGESPINEQELNYFLIFNQTSRICQDIKALIHRSITSFERILKLQRMCIQQSQEQPKDAPPVEFIHLGPTTYSLSSSVTQLVVSLCSSLDVSSKLLNYINSTQIDSNAFKPAKGKLFSDVRNIKSENITDSGLKIIKIRSDSSKNIRELFQLRHDLIHSTTAIELEKIYVGYGTEEVNSSALHYSAQYARDCLENGQPVRFLGRDYFVESKLDIEGKCLEWITEVIDYHISLARTIIENIKSK